MLNTWRKIPVVRLVLPFIAGILFQINIGWSPVFSAVFSGFLLVLLAIITHWRTLREHSHKLFNTTLTLLFFSLGATLYSVHSVDFDTHHFGRFERVELMDAVLVSSPERTANSYKTTLEIRNVLAKGEYHRVTGKCLLYVSNQADMNWQKGDRVLVTRAPRAIDSPQNPDEFDYQNFLKNHGITHSVYLRDPAQAVSIKADFDPGIFKQFDESRDYLIAELEKALNDRDAFAVSSALILGQKEFLSPQIRQTYASTGAMHVLAVSGLHVGIIYLILMGALKWLGSNRLGMGMRLLLILTGLWSYAVITGLSPSVLRAATMFSAVAIAQNIGRKTNIYNTLAAAALVLLCINPLLINEVGFQLSFSAVLGIVLLQPHIYGLFVVPTWLLDKLWQLTSVSFAAQIATFPLGIYYFHQFPNYFLLSNFVVIPAAFVVLIAGLVFFATSKVPWIGEWFGELLNGIVVVLNMLVRAIENLPYSLTDGLFSTVFETWGLYALIGFCIALVYRKDVHYVLGALIIGVVLLGSFSWRLFERKKQQTVSVNQISGHFAINLIDGNQNILIADSALLADTRKQEFHLVNHWNRRGFRDAQKIDISDTTEYKLPGFYRKDDFISFHGFRMLLVPERRERKNEIQLLPDMDLVIFGDRTRWRDAAMLKVPLVVSSSYRYRNLCCDSVPEYYDVRKKGALLVELSKSAAVDSTQLLGLLK